MNAEMSPDLRRELRLQWGMYFGAVHSLQEHPGQNRENATPKTPAQSARVADEMLLELMSRIETGAL